MKIKKPTAKVVIIMAFVMFAMVSGITIAAFGDKGEILGSSFSVGSADIKLLKDLAGPTSGDNLAEELNGPNFINISPNWTQDYALKIFNNASTHVQLTSNADYETANDPDDLRQLIFVEPIAWNDQNNDGLHEESELGSTYGKKTIVKWKTEGFDLSSIASGATKGLVLRFSTEAVSDTKQGKTAVFDFEFDSLAIE